MRFSCIRTAAGDEYRRALRTFAPGAWIRVARLVSRPDCVFGSDLPGNRRVLHSMVGPSARYDGHAGSCDCRDHCQCLSDWRHESFFEMDARGNCRRWLGRVNPRHNGRLAWSFHSHHGRPGESGRGDSRVGRGHNTVARRFGCSIARSARDCWLAFRAHPKSTAPS